MSDHLSEVVSELKRSCTSEASLRTEKLRDREVKKPFEHGFSDISQRSQGVEEEL